MSLHPRPYPAPSPPPLGVPAPRPALEAARQTLAGYLTEADWDAALQRIEQQPAPRVEQNRRVGRERIPRRLNCLIRLGDDKAPPGIHLVRTRNISSGGLSIVHGSPLDLDTPLVVAIEAAAGQGLIQRACVVWTRPINTSDPTEPPAYEMGLKFDRDIFVDQFLGL